MRRRLDLPPGMAEKEPNVRKDGRCVLCGGERPLVALNNGDPFCSTACSRKYHGVADKGVGDGDADDAD
jgi:hypothetical protein